MKSHVQRHAVERLYWGQQCAPSSARSTPKAGMVSQGARDLGSSIDRNTFLSWKTYFASICGLWTLRQNQLNTVKPMRTPPAFQATLFIHYLGSDYYLQNQILLRFIISAIIFNLFHDVVKKKINNPKTMASGARRPSPLYLWYLHFLAS